MNSANRIWGLDLLRAAAVIGVLLSHLSYHTGVNFLQKIFPVGPVMGVELFFVLSGFLIGQILIKQVETTDFNLQQALMFMKRRWARTLPNYYLFLVVMLVLQWNVGKEHILSFMFFMQNFFSKPVAGFYGVTWSLTIEEIFYVSFPLLLFAVGACISSKRSKVLVVICAFLAVPLLIKLFLYDDGEFTKADYRKGAIIRLDAIAYGVLAAYVKIYCVRLWGFLSQQGIFLLLPFWYFFFLNFHPKLSSNDWGSIYFPVFSFTAALMLPFFDSIKEHKGVLAAPVMFIALISYSLYLCHIPVIIVSNNLLHVNDYLAGHYLECYYVFSSMLVAYFMYLFWEIPMKNLMCKF